MNELKTIEQVGIVAFTVVVLFGIIKTLWVDNNKTSNKWREQLEKRIADLEKEAKEQRDLHRIERDKMLDLMKENREALNKATSNFERKEEFTHQQTMEFIKSTNKGFEIIENNNRTLKDFTIAVQNLSSYVKKGTEVHQKEINQFNQTKKQ